MLSDKELIRLALLEDVGAGDITSSAVLKNARLKPAGAIIASRSNGVVSGEELVMLVFDEIVGEEVIRFVIPDGHEVVPGEVVAEISGKPENLLMGERLALNLLAHMSGIATQTRRLVRLIHDYNAKLLDTRKTTPLWRKWEKRAVRDGGGLNHRMGLYDHVLIKDNHIAVVGSIQDAVKHVRRNASPVYKVEIEVDTWDGFAEALECDVDWIMLDNFQPGDVARAVEAAAGKVVLEASGGINESNIVEFAKTGVDFISTSDIIKGARPLDFAIDF